MALQVFGHLLPQQAQQMDGFRSAVSFRCEALGWAGIDRFAERLPIVANDRPTRKSLTAAVLIECETIYFCTVQLWL